MREIEKQLSDILRFHRDHALAAAIDPTRPSSPSQQTLTIPCSPIAVAVHRSSGSPRGEPAVSTSLKSTSGLPLPEFHLNCAGEGRLPTHPCRAQRRRSHPIPAKPSSRRPLSGPVGAAIFQVRAVTSRASDSGFPA